MIRALVFAALTPLFAAEPARLLTADELKALEAKVESGRATRDEEILLGRMYGFAIRGVTELRDPWTPAAQDDRLRRGPAAAHARQALARSKRGAVLGTAAEALYGGCCGGPTSADRKLSAKLLDRAIEAEPEESAWRVHRIVDTYGHFNFLLRRPNPRDALRVMESDLAVVQGERRYLAMRCVAAMALRAGDLGKAEAWSEELLRAARRDESSGYYGEAVFYGHMVLGQVALRRGEMESARMHLIESADTPGSPVLSSFGPNTSLARDMLRAGERAAVIEFLELTKSFWPSPHSNADRWIAAIRAGGTPDWRASPYY